MLCVYIYIYVYTYICGHVYVCIYIYIYIHIEMLLKQGFVHQQTQNEFVQIRISKGCFTNEAPTNIEQHVYELQKAVSYNGPDSLVG